MYEPGGVAPKAGVAATKAEGAIQAITSMAMRQALAELVDTWQGQGGGPVNLLAIGGVDVARRIRAGEAFDVVVLATEAIAALQAEGHLDASMRQPLARSAMAIAVPADAPRLRIDSESAVRDAVLGARRIGSSTGPSGAALDRLLAQWGIAEQVGPRMVIAPPGTPVGALLARGEADLGFQQLSELVHVEGIQVLGTLPPPIAVLTEFAAGLGAISPRKAHARALLDWLAAGHADILRRNGMEGAQVPRLR